VSRAFSLAMGLCVAAAACVGASAAAPGAAGCPGEITQDTTLTEDVVASPGGPTECFHFAASGITLNLNGHTVDIRPLHMSGRAVVVDGFDDATIEGPGTVIAGYDDPALSPRAFRIRATSHLTIENVHELNLQDDGQPIPHGERPGRGMDLEMVRGANIVHNEVAYFGRGIYFLDGVGEPGFDAVRANRVHDNAIDLGSARSFGIGLFGSSYWQITGNRATANGSLVNDEAGIEIQTGSYDNVVSGNRSVGNLGPGVSADVGTHGNVFAANVARNNGGPDLVDYNPPTIAPHTNTWSADNRCGSAAGSVPPGVCRTGP
jgi:hypothetical protein